MYRLQKMLRTLLGMTLFSAVLFFGTTLLVTGLSTTGEIVVTAVISVIFGLIFSISMRKRMGSLLFIDMNKDQYDQQRKFGKMLEREEIPKSKTDRTQYLDFLNKLEKVFEVAVGKKNMILLLLPSIAAIQVIMFTKGLPPIRLLAIILVLSLAVSYYMSAKKYQKIQRLKSRLGKA